MCDEWKISIDSGVCHRLWSISWSIVQICSLTVEYRVFQYVPSTNISEQFESILLKSLQQISILLLWNDGHQCMEVFQFPPRKFATQTWFCNCQTYLYLFHIVVECSPSIHDPGKMLVLPNQLLCLVPSTSDQCFCFFPANFMSSTNTDKNNPSFTMYKQAFPNKKPSPNRTSIGFLKLPFP